MAILQHINRIFEQVSEKKREALLKILKKAFNIDENDFTEVRWSEVLLNDILEVDQTPNKQYAQWLITKIIIPHYTKKTGVGGMTWDNYRFREDYEEISDLIQLHFNKKQSPDFPSDIKDINKVNSISELRDGLSKYRASVDDSFDEILQKTGVKQGVDYDIVLTDNTVTVYIPKTEMGSCALGGKSSWCTTYGKYSVNPDYKRRTHNAFESYNTQGNLYIIRHKDDEIYQIHFKRDEFMDADNDYVGLENIFDGVSEEAKNKFAQIVFDNKDVHESEFSDVSTITFSDREDMAKEFLHYDDRHYAQIVSDDFWYESDYIDYDITYYDNWTSEGFDLIRETCIDIEFENEDDEVIVVDKEYVDSLTDSELLEMIDKYDEFSDIKDAIQLAISNLKNRANEAEAYKSIMNVVAMNMGFSDYEELQENMEYTNDEKVTVKMPHTDVEVTPFEKLYIITKEDDDEKELEERVHEPQYGWDGDIDWDDSFEELSFRLGEI